MVPGNLLTIFGMNSLDGFKENTFYGQMKVRMRQQRPTPCHYSSADTVNAEPTKPFYNLKWDSS